jgi:hypothetical protein
VRYRNPIAARPNCATEARLLAGAAAVLAAAVLGDSAIEHYRGSFRNAAMFAALGASGLGLVASIDGGRAIPSAHSDTRRAVYGIALATGAIGTGFHIYNLLKRPGRLSLLDFFYGAPIGAPAALALSGMVGLAAEELRAVPRGGAPRILDMPAGRCLAALAAIGIAGTVGEVGLLHFRGSFQNRAMYLPVTVPPVAALLLAKASLLPQRREHGFTRFWLTLTAVLGAIGPLFHGFGVHRAMGGWKNWRQNVLSGPPLPAPPAFTGLSIAGLAALRLIERFGR